MGTLAVERITDPIPACFANDVRLDDIDAYMSDQSQFDSRFTDGLSLGHSESCYRQKEQRQKGEVGRGRRRGASDHCVECAMATTRRVERVGVDEVRSEDRNQHRLDCERLCTWPPAV